MNPNQLNKIKLNMSQYDVFSVSDLMNSESISQPTASRLVSRLRKTGQIVTVGAGRNTRYAFTDGSPSIQILGVQTTGVSTAIGHYYRLASGASYVGFEKNVASVLKGVHGNGLFEGALPFFLDDMKPEGFLGIRNAQEFMAFGFPANLGSWSHEQILMYLKAKGYECKGNVIVDGDYHLNHLEDETCELRDYPALAKETLQNYSPRHSSAGGEQPKFTAYRKGVGHVIVKFAKRDSSIDGRRADLLICEHLANKALKKYGFDVAQTEIHIMGDDVFLESVRFDRQAEAGRSPMLSMLAIDAEYVGLCNSWSETAKKLQDMQLISLETCASIQDVEAFGHLIANTDMHLGNLSFTISEDGNTFDLLPIYDMTPMAFMPSNDVMLNKFEIKEPLAVNSETRQAAQYFWELVTVSELVSDELRKIASGYISSED